MMKSLAQGALWIAALALLGMVLIEGWQVLARYVFNDSPSWTEPCAVLLINTAMMFSAAVAVHRQNHFAFTVLADSVPPAVKRVLSLIRSLVVLLMGGMLSGYGTFMVADTWPVKLAGAALRQGVMYLPVMLGGALMMVFAVHQLLSSFGARNAAGETP